MSGGTGNFLLEKAEAFALRIVRLYQHLNEKGERVMSKQVLRSGTSVGANITEGHYGASKADFINKYVIAEKEAGETLYWLRLLIKSGYSATLTSYFIRHTSYFLPMTANRRIFLNIVATYGRSLYALVIGLFCGRRTLIALGIWS